MSARHVDASQRGLDDRAVAARAGRLTCMIRFDDVTKRTPTAPSPSTRLDLEAPSGQITVLVGPVGLRQDDVAAHDQPDDRAHLRARSGSTTQDTASDARPHELRRRHRLRDPARRAVPAPHRRGQRRDGAAAARRRQAAGPRPGDGAARAGRPGPGVRQALPGPALRRPAAARRRRPGAGRRPAGDADGRAVLAPSTRSSATSCRTSSSGCRASSARRSSSSPTTSTRRSSSATRSRSCASAASSPSWPRRPSCSRDPVDDFVAGFVGRDRGYRALGFDATPATLPTRRRAHRRRWARRPTGGDRDGWLAGRRRRRPQAAGLAANRTVAGRGGRPDMLHRGGTLATHGRLAARRARRRAVLAVRPRRRRRRRRVGWSARSRRPRSSTLIERSGRRGDEPGLAGTRQGPPRDHYFTDHLGDILGRPVSTSGSRSCPS